MTADVLSAQRTSRLINAGEVWEFLPESTVPRHLRAGVSPVVIDAVEDDGERVWITSPGQGGRMRIEVVRLRQEFRPVPHLTNDTGDTRGQRVRRVPSDDAIGHRWVPIQDRGDESVKTDGDARLLSTYPEFLTVDETAVVLRIGRSAAYAAVRSEQIPSIRIGHSLRVPRGWLEALLTCDVDTMNSGAVDEEPGKKPNVRRAWRHA